MYYQLSVKIKFLTFIFWGFFFIFGSMSAHAEVGFGISNVFKLDTRENIPPDGPWQILTNKGDSFNEDLLIDNLGKVWAFYMLEKGKGKPVYMKIIRPSGYVYKPEEQIGTSSTTVAYARQSIRAVLNPVTNEVWVAIQGDQGENGSYFLIFDSTGTQKGQKQVIQGDPGVYFPKLACDQDGKMWFIWQTDSVGSGTSIPQYSCYDRNGTKMYGPTNVRNVGPTTGTDIVIDKLNRIWFIYERGNTHLFTRIVNNDVTQTEFQVETTRHQVADPFSFNIQRIAYSDTASNRVWILAKNAAYSQQKILIFDLDGDPVGVVEGVGNVNFAANELDRLEIVQENSSNYRMGEFNPSNGNPFTKPSYAILFSGVHSFVRNGLAFNRQYGQVKAYLVQTDNSTTKFYLKRIVNAPDLATTPKFINFGPIRIRSQKSEKVLLENRGTAPLNISNIISSNNQFLVDKTSFVLAPGGYDWLNVIFQPELIDNIQGDLTIYSNDPDSSQYKLPLEGEGRDYLTQKIVLLSDTLFFGTVPTSSFQQMQLGIKNEGEKDLRIDSLKFFHQAYSAPKDTLHVRPGRTRELTVNFKPTVPESIKSTLKIFHNDPLVGGISFVELIGVGRKPNSQKIFIEQKEINFGDVAIGESKTQSLSIQNKGELPLQITNVQASQTYFKPLQLELTLQPGETAPIDMMFSPQAVDTLKGKLTITSNDPETPKIDVNLIGVGKKVNKPDIWTSTDTLYFGSVKVGRSRSQLLKVQNNGDKTLTISKLMMFGSQFTFNSAMEFSLEPAAYHWIEISYLPDTLALQKGYLLIFSNDPDTDTLRIGLAGQGVETSPPQIKVEPYELIFDTTAIGQEKSLWLHITNTGDEVLQIEKISTTRNQFKANSSGFSILTNQPHYLTVTFKPDPIGLVDGNLLIISNDPVLDTLKVNLTGVGRAPHPAKIYLTGSLFDFGTIGVGKSETQIILVSNRGEAPLTIEKVESTDQQFTCPVKNLTIPPQGSDYLPVVFTPGSVGSVSAAVKIYNNDPTNNQKTITVRGTGRSLYPALISVSPEQLNFDTVPIGRQLEKNLWIFNKGEQKLSITKIQISDQQFTAPAGSYTIDAGKFLALPVTFKPTKTGQTNGHLWVSSNVNPDEPVDIALTGVGRELNPAQISVKPEYLNFGSVPVNGHLSKNLYIYNNGEVPLNISQIYTENNLFSVNASVFTINPNRSQLLIVTYSPTQLTRTQTNLVLISNSSKDSTLRVPLDGQGRAAYPPQMVVRPDTINFGSVPQYREKTYAIEIQNSGEVALNINRIRSGDDEFAIPADENSFELQPGQKRYVSVKFNPYKIRDINVPITIESDAPTTPEKTVYLIGEVRKLIPANIAFEPENVVFESTGTGFWVSKIIQVKNTGESSLNIRNIKSNNEKYISTKIYKMDIPPESSQPLEIIFAPAEVKKYEAILTFESNASDKPVADLPVEGTGREKIKQQIIINPDTLSFGTTGVARSVNRSFTISNPGESTLIINNILSSNEQFQVDSTSFKIDPLHSRQVQAIFHPTAVGNINGSLTIYSNDPANSQKQLALNGTGRDLISQQIVVTPDTLKFDSVNVEQSRQLALNVWNSGDYPLVVSKIHSGDKQFQVTDTTFTVESGQSHAVPITFQPNQMGSLSTLLIIYNNDPEKQVLEIPVTGIGRLLNEQRITLDSDTLAFGAVPIGEISRQKIWVTNLGEKTLKIDSVLISRTYFTVDDNTFDVAPLSSQELWVSFKPVNYDTIRARMTIKSNDNVEPTVHIGLSGSGRDLLTQKIDVSPDSLKFNPVGWGESHSKPIYIRNVGEKSLVISDIIISDTTYFKIKANGMTIPANKSEIIYVTFSPKPIGADSVQREFDTVLSIFSNDLTNQEKQIILVGTGRPLSGPIINSPVEDINFGTIPVGRSISRTVRIHNLGEQPLIISNIEIQTENYQGQFEINKKGTTIQPNSGADILVNFVPTQVNNIQTKLVISSNDITNPAYFIKIVAASIEYAGPKIVVRPEKINFGSLLVGAKRVLSTYIYNEGPKKLKITNVTSTDATHFKPNVPIFNIQPGDSSRLDITFHPDNVGEFNASMILNSNDEYNSNILLPLSGKGARDSLGQNVMADMNWSDHTTPFTATFLSGKKQVWLIKDFEIYQKVSAAVLRLAYHEVIKVYLNGILILDGSNDVQVFNYWNKELINLQNYLMYGRNRLAILVQADDSQPVFDAELILNSSIQAFKTKNWWYYVGDAAPVMAGTGKTWTYYEYGWTKLDSVVGHWTFQEGIGDTLYDQSPYGRRAILFDTKWVQGLAGYGLEFNGTTSYVKMEANINTLPLAIQMWIKPTAAITQRQVLLSNAGAGGYGRGFYITADSLVVNYYNGRYRVPFSFAANKWYFISVKYVSDSIYVYLNGNAAGKYKYGTNQKEPTGYSYCYLGKYTSASATFRPFKGIVSDLQLYNISRLSQSVPAVVNVVLVNSVKATAGSEVTMEFKLDPAISQIQTGGYIKYRIGGKKQIKFKSIAVVNDSLARVNLPAEDVTISGFDYRINLNTNLGAINYPKGPDSTKMVWQMVQTVGEKSPNQVPSDIYYMFSVPYDLGNKTVAAVLGDDLGIYDPFNWRVLRWRSASNTSGRYLEYEEAGWKDDEENFTRGNAFWTIAFDPPEFYDADSGYSAENALPHQVKLNPGWNQIGCPFPYPVSWDSVTNREHVSSLYFYNHEIRGYEVDHKTLVPWQGYFVNNNLSYQLTIEIPAREAAIALQKVTPVQQFALENNQSEMVLNLAAKCGLYHDGDNLVAVTQNAANGWDPADAYEAPPIGNYISVWFDNTSWKEKPGAYTFDIRQSGQRGYVWNIVCEASVTGLEEKIEFNFENIFDPKSDQELFLFDLVDEVAVNLKEKSYYTFDLNSEKNVKRAFKLVMGDEAFVRENGDGIPLEELTFDLLPNYPNPFNPMTSIQFSVPKKTQIHLAVYNILGQEVIVLVDEVLKPARHQVIWNGKDTQGLPVSSGIYLLKLKSAEQVKTHKMILIK